MNKLAMPLIVLAFLIATAAQAALVISNPGFEGGSFTEVDTTFTDGDNALDQWVLYGNTYDPNNRNWTMRSTGGDPNGYADGTLGNSTSYRRAIYQAVTDNKATTGVMDMTFDLNLNDAASSSSYGFDVAIWGIADSSSSFSFSTTGTAVMNANVGAAVFLGGLNIKTNTSGWETKTIPSIDFGTGYDLVVIGFKANNYSFDDTAGIDNVAVVPEPVTMGVLAIGGLALLRRRR